MFSTGQDVGGFPYARAYRNFLPYYPSNMKPDPPGSTGATVQGNDVVLSWGPGSDGASPAGALTYNIRIGTGPGADDVMPSNASQTGRRLLSAPGNAGHNLGWNVKNLTPGVYYWSVQTIDAAYLGSDFSEEGSFTIQP
jgi:hypothetical protein